MKQDVGTQVQLVAIKGKALLEFNQASKQFDIKVGSVIVDHAQSYPMALAKLEMYK